MPLDELLDTIETLKRQIEAHGATLSGNESQTRYALIDPLLRALGWDTGDQTQVVPEYSASGGRADYALLNSHGKPAIMVEAKRLNRPLEDGLSQSIAYCVEQGTPYFCVTDGQHWALYETFRQVAVKDKLVTEFDLLGNSAPDVCLTALALWRPNVAQGQVRIGQTPVVGARGTPAAATRGSVVVPTVGQPAPEWQCPDCDEALPTQDSRRIARHRQEHTLRPEGESPATRRVANEGEGWVTLTELQAKPYAKPRGLLVPTGEQVSATSWTELAVQLTQWLVDRGRLSSDSGPIRHGKRYLLATEPIHPNGNEFINPRRVGPLWLNSNYSAADHVRNAKRIVTHAGLDPAEFKVRLAD